MIDVFGRLATYESSLMSATVSSFTRRASCTRTFRGALPRNHDVHLRYVD